MLTKPVENDKSEKEKLKKGNSEKECFSRDKMMIPLTRSDRTLTGQRNRSQFHVELNFELLEASSLR